jgi:hypothetical protein
MIRTIRPVQAGLGTVLLLVMAASVQAASLSYYLDQSNALPDGPAYLKVTVADDGLASPDTIFFTLEILDPLLQLAGTNFGIQRFAFNSTLAPIDLAYKIGDLPPGWGVVVNGAVSEFGVFELIPTGSGSTRQAPVLTFSIDSSAFPSDSLYDYVQYADCPEGDGPEDPEPLTCIPTGGPSYFAAHVAGFNAPGGIRSAYFGGETSADGEQVVPVPAAAWLLGSAVGLLGLVRRLVGVRVDFSQAENPL